MWREESGDLVTSVLCTSLMQRVVQTDTCVYLVSSVHSRQNQEEWGTGACAPPPLNYKSDTCILISEIVFPMH